jgi:hypothetical protein
VYVDIQIEVPDESLDLAVVGRDRERIQAHGTAPLVQP